MPVCLSCAQPKLSKDFGPNKAMGPKPSSYGNEVDMDPTPHQPNNDVDSPGPSQTKPNRKQSPPLAGEGTDGALVLLLPRAPPNLITRPRAPLPPPPAHAKLAPSPDPSPAGMIRGDGGPGAVVRRTSPSSFHAPAPATAGGGGGRLGARAGQRGRGGPRAQGHPLGRPAAGARAPLEPLRRAPARRGSQGAPRVRATGNCLSIQVARSLLSIPSKLLGSPVVPSVIRCSTDLGASLVDHQLERSNSFSQPFKRKTCTPKSED